jgi:hypothetical protein
MEINLFSSKLFHYLRKGWFFPSAKRFGCCFSFFYLRSGMLQSGKEGIYRTKKLNSFPLELQQFNEHIIANMDKNFLYQ